MDQPITIVLVDDHAVVRQGFALQINAEPDMVVVGQAEDADTAIDVVLRCRPQIVLFDINLPGLSCFAALRTIASRVSGIRVIFLSAFTSDRQIDQALSVDAQGYVTKAESFATLRDAIRQVAAGKRYFSDRIKSRILVSKSGPKDPVQVKSRSLTLTAREREVLGYLAQGMAVKEVARVMHLSAKTVDNHKSRIMAKLNVHDRVELVRYALREGIVTF